MKILRHQYTTNLSQSHITQPILYKVNVWKWNHESFLLNEHHDNIIRKSLESSGEITPFPLSAPLLGTNRTDFAFTEFSRKDFSKQLKTYLNMRDNQEW